jgi:DNA-binding transcriptional LysR family regulator
MTALPESQREHVNLISAGGPVRFRQDGIALAIRRDDFPVDPAIWAETLVAEQVGPVCTPAIAETLRTPADLRDKQLLQSQTRPDAWSNWFSRQSIDVDASDAQTFEHFYIAIEAATAGLGVAIASRLMTADATRARTLVAPFGFIEDGSNYQLLSPRAPAEDPRLNFLLDFLRHQAKAP